MTEQQEKKIRAWMGYIGETDRASMDETMDDCRANADTLRYFLSRAEEMPGIPCARSPHKRGSRPGYVFLPPFSVDKARQETVDSEMEKIRQVIPCRSSKTT